MKTPSKLTPEQFGERRHESCVYGTLTPVWSDNKSYVKPLCGYMPPDPIPPPLARAWGGALVDYEKDCALCLRYTELDIQNG